METEPSAEAERRLRGKESDGGVKNESEVMEAVWLWSRSVPREEAEERS